MTKDKVQKHIFISGRVQSVGFRAFTKREASALNVKGWVKNLRDGRVELVIQAKKNNIDKMIQKIKKGPSFAKVENIEIKEENLSDFKKFKIKY